MQTVTGAMEVATRLFDWATDFNSAVTVTLGATRLGTATGGTAAGATANFGSRGLFDSIKTDFGFEWLTEDFNSAALAGATAGTRFDSSRGFPFERQTEGFGRGEPIAFTVATGAAGRRLGEAFDTERQAEGFSGGRNSQWQQTQH